jgi:hypothetical protein
MIDQLGSLLSGPNLVLTTFELSNASAAQASALFKACPAFVSSFVTNFGIRDTDPSSITSLDFAPQELHVVINDSLLEFDPGPFLLACLSAPAAAKLERLAVQGFFAKTYVFFEGWKGLAKWAKASGVEVTLYDSGTSIIRRREVVVVV